MDTSDKRFMMVFTAVLGVLVAIGVTVALVANLAGSVDYDKSTAQVKLATARIKPVGNVSLASNPMLASAVAASTPVEQVPSTPESVYNSSCGACHASGAAGAPVFGDKAAWTARIAQGKTTLYASAINGKGLMAAKGGNVLLSDDEVKAAVDYMLDAVK